MILTNKISIVIPAKDEARALETFLPELRRLYSDAQILVVNDGSTDDTEEVCLSNSVEVFSHVYSMGNGAAIKSGARVAKGEYFESRKWLEIAGINGQKVDYIISKFENEMTPAQIAEAQKLAREWMENHGK